MWTTFALLKYYLQPQNKQNRLFKVFLLSFFFLVFLLSKTPFVAMRAFFFKEKKKKKSTLYFAFC